LIACAGKAGPWPPPIIGVLGGPDEIGRAQEPVQGPCRIVRNIGREAELTAPPQHPRERGDACILDEPPLSMSPLRPRVWIEQIETRERSIRQPCEYVYGIAVVETNVQDGACLNGRERLGHAIHKWLYPNKA